MSPISPCGDCYVRAWPNAAKPHCKEKQAGTAPDTPCPWKRAMTLSDHVTVANRPETAPAVRVTLPSALVWNQLRQLGRVGPDKVWLPNDDVAEYFDRIAEPTREFPHGYAKAAMTFKFQKWLMLFRPSIAYLFWR